MRSIRGVMADFQFNGVTGCRLRYYSYPLFFFVNCLLTNYCCCLLIECYFKFPIDNCWNFSEFFSRQLPFRSAG
jgi:hypothetical protein